MLAFLLLFVTLGRLYRDMFKRPETRALLMLAVLVLIVGVVFYVNVEHWTLLNAIYFCVVTLGTVGYGDITPTTDLGKVFTIAYIIVGLSVIGGFFATIGRMIDPQQVLSRPAGLREIVSKERERLPHLTRHDEANEPQPDDKSQID